MVRSSMPVDPQAWEGVYGFCHDGWLANLELHHSGEAAYSGRFTDLGIWGRVHDVTAMAELSEPGRLDLVVHRFNELPEQHFTLYSIGRGLEAFAGFAYWRSETFGCCGVRGPVPALGYYGDPGNAVQRQDFLGRYIYWHSHGAGWVSLISAGRRTVAIYRAAAGDEEVRVAARLGGDADHHVRIEVPTGNAMGDFVGYLFTRPKNAIAGTVEVNGERSGCLFVRVSDRP